MCEIHVSDALILMYLQFTLHISALHEEPRLNVTPGALVAHPHSLYLVATELLITTGPLCFFLWNDIDGSAFDGVGFRGF